MRSGSRAGAVGAVAVAGESASSARIPASVCLHLGDLCGHPVAVAAVAGRRRPIRGAYSGGGVTVAARAQAAGRLPACSAARGRRRRVRGARLRGRAHHPAREGDRQQHAQRGDPERPPEGVARGAGGLARHDVVEARTRVEARGGLAHVVGELADRDPRDQLRRQLGHVVGVLDVLDRVLQRLVGGGDRGGHHERDADGGPELPGGVHDRPTPGPAAARTPRPSLPR